MKKFKLLLMMSAMVVAGGAGFIRASHAQEGDKGKKSVAPQAKKVSPPAQAETPPAPQTSGKRSRSGIFSRVYIADIVATIIYSLLGLFIALFGYKVYDWITPFDLRKELEIDQNTSLGIVAGSIILGLCIIIAASIMSP